MTPVRLHRRRSAFMEVASDRMVPRDTSTRPDHLARMLANQRRRHLVAQLMTARRLARQLEALVVRGTSPTGYGAPLEPLPPDEATNVLEPVKRLLERWRQLAAEHSADELEAVDLPRPVSQTRRWARTLLRNLGDLVSETAHDAWAAEQRSGPGRDAADFARVARELLAEAGQMLRDEKPAQPAWNRPADD